MIWISVEDVILIHSRVIEGSGGLDGLRDRSGLEAAVFAPMQTLMGKSSIHRISKKSPDLALVLHPITLLWTVISESAP